ncbi:MAG: cohesin domain-containing protein [Candidatus Paceibacterota bacterium]|jgi:hypothetical protein
MITFSLKNKIGLVSFATILFLVPYLGMATDSSSIYLKSSDSTVALKSDFNVDVLLNTSVPINAIDLQISYSSDKLKFKSFNDANSIIDLWHGGPTLLKDGHIELIGAIFKPYNGNDGQIIRLSFETLSAGNGEISFEKNNLYLADGKGTKILANNSSISVYINETVSQNTILENSTKDATLPDIFLNVSRGLADGNSLIVFNATDKESGIKLTEMRTKKWFNWNNWQVVQNPVLYPSGVWKIQIRTTNNDNLTAIKTLSLMGKLFEKLFLVILLPLFVVLIIVLRIKKKT